MYTKWIILTMTVCSLLEQALLYRQKSFKSNHVLRYLGSQPSKETELCAFCNMKEKVAVMKKERERSMKKNVPEKMMPFLGDLFNVPVYARKGANQHRFLLTNMDKMRNLAAILLCTLISKLDFIRGLETSRHKIVWPVDYNIKYEILHPIHDVIEHYEAWYMNEANMLRIDANGGEVKRYYLRDNSSDDDVTLYMLHLETTQDLTMETKCYTNTVSSFSSVLPSVSGFKYKGTEKFNGLTVKFFEGRRKIPKVGTFEKKMYVYRDGKVDVPVLYELKSFDYWSGTLSTHTIKYFYEYDPEVNKEDVEVPEDFDVFDCHEMNSIDIGQPIKFGSLQANVPMEFETAFEYFKVHHGKEYYDEEEHELRKTIFKKNWSKIVDHNEKDLGYKMTLNYFTDRTDEELNSMGCLLNLHHKQTDLQILDSSQHLETLALELDLPEELDLRVKGVVTPVKSQMSCGSCWAFSITAAVEGALALRNGGRLLDLSEQSLVDCAWGFENRGCNGGDLQSAFKYVVKYGMPTEREYGNYLMQDGECHIENMTEIFEIKGFAKFTPHSETALKVALYKYGPVAVAIHVSPQMQRYSSGIFFDTKCEGLDANSVNHGVTVVGYGQRDGTPYWIVKNSWGSEWGEGGYILMSAERDNCFVLDEGYYAVA